MVTCCWLAETGRFNGGGRSGVGALSGQSLPHTLRYDAKEAGLCILCRLLDLTMLDEIMDSKGDPVTLAVRMMCTDAGVIRSNAEGSTLLF